MASKLASPRTLRQAGVPAARWGAAGVAGLAAFLAFPPGGLTPLAFVALIPLLWAAYAPVGPAATPLGFRQRFLLGFTAQGVFFFALLHWILLLPNEEVTIPGLMIPALLFMSGYLAVFFGLAVALAGWIERRAGLPAATAFPIFWTLADFARSVGALAFPWGSLGYALAPRPELLQLTAWTGYWGLPFWITAVNALGYASWRAWGERPRTRALARAGGAVLLAAVPAIHGAVLLHRAPAPELAAPHGMRFALLQANTPREIKWRPGYEAAVIDDLLERTRQAADADPDLIVWPETSAPLVLLWHPELADRVRGTVAELERWTLVGTLDAHLLPGNDIESYNAALLFDPEGDLAGRYRKQKLVPFSERMPFQEALPWLNVLNFGQSDFTPGPPAAPFAVGERRISVLICFEAIFPEVARRGVLDGAEYLVNITNDFWFGRSAGPVQHAQMAVLRAVENRTPLVRCANSGISCFIDPWGRVQGATPLFVEAMPTAALAPGGGGSFATRHGNWVIIGLGALGLVALVPALRPGSGRGRRRSDIGGASGPTGGPQRPGDEETEARERRGP